MKYICPKCGLEDINLKYYESGDALPAKINEDFEKKKDRFRKFSDIIGDFPYHKIKITKECLEVHCRTCQHSWVTDTIETLKEKYCSCGYGPYEVKDNKKYCLTCNKEIKEIK